jgi:hypothetical protein
MALKITKGNFKSLLIMIVWVMYNQHKNLYQESKLLITNKLNKNTVHPMFASGQQVYGYDTLGF